MSHRFLIDMNLSPAWVERLAQDGWLGVHWSSVGDQRATDMTVMEDARTNDFVVFTHNLDLTAAAESLRSAVYRFGPRPAAVAYVAITAVQ